MLNFPARLKENAAAKPLIADAIDLVRKGRKRLHLPELESFWVDEYGNAKPIS